MIEGRLTMSPTSFSIDAFLASEKPWKYLDESGFEGPDWRLTETQLGAVRAALPEMGWSHLAMALVLAERHAPRSFADQAAGLLGHPSMSVRINAYRVLRAVPRGEIDDVLEEAVNAGLTRCPERADFKDALA